jgi:hypothetical protein
MSIIGSVRLESESPLTARRPTSSPAADIQNAFDDVFLWLLGPEGNVLVDCHQDDVSRSLGLRAEADLGLLCAVVRIPQLSRTGLILRKPGP